MKAPEWDRNRHVAVEVLFKAAKKQEKSHRKVLNIVIKKRAFSGECGLEVECG